MRLFISIRMCYINMAGIAHLDVRLENIAFKNTHGIVL